MSAVDDAQEHVRRVAQTRLAESLQKLRSRDALSLHALSDKSQLDRKVLRGLESGTLNPSLKTMDRLAATFGVSLAELLGGEAVATPGFLGSSALVALNVKRLRRSRSWTTGDLESRIRMKAAYVSFIETGRAGCTLLTLARFAAGFGIEISELFRPPMRQERSKSKTSIRSSPGKPEAEMTLD